MPLECALTYSDGIVGSNTKGGRTNTSAVIEFEHKVSSPVDTQMGIVTGARVHDSVVLKKPIDTASPPLYQACCNGTTLESMKIDFYNITPEGQETIYYTITLSNVKVTSVKEILPNTKDPSLESQVHLEEVKLLYERINWMHHAGYEYEDAWVDPQK